MTERPARGVDAQLPMIRGRLVFLRPQEPDDVATVHRWYENAETAALMGELPRSLAVRNRRFTASMDGRDFYAFMVCRLEDGVAVGRSDLFDIDHLRGSAAFGLAIGEPAMRGRGYGRDAVEALSDFAFGELRLERLALVTDAHNERAQRTYRAAGFTVEVVERRAFYQHGRFTDDVHMSLLRGEWASLPRQAGADAAV